MACSSGVRSCPSKCLTGFQSSRRPPACSPPAGTSKRHATSPSGWATCPPRVAAPTRQAKLNPLAAATGGRTCREVVELGLRHCCSFLLRWPRRRRAGPLVATVLLVRRRRRGRLCCGGGGGGGHSVVALGGRGRSAIAQVAGVVGVPGQRVAVRRAQLVHVDARDARLEASSNGTGRRLRNAGPCTSRPDGPGAPQCAPSSHRPDARSSRVRHRTRAACAEMRLVI